MSVTVGATTIDIDAGTTETLKGVYDAVAASGFPGHMTEDVINNGYTINGNIRIDVNLGSTLDVTNATYVNGWLRWGSRTANAAPGWYNWGTVDIQAPGFELDLDVNDGNYNYIYSYGIWIMIGTAINPIVLKHLYMLRFYCNYADPVIQIQYVTQAVESSYSSGSGVMFYFAGTDPGMGSRPVGYIKNVTKTNVVDNRDKLFFVAYGVDVTGLEIADIAGTELLYGLSCYGNNIKITGLVLTRTHFGATQQFGDAGGWQMKRQYDNYKMQETLRNQPKTTFVDGVFTDNYNGSSTEIGSGRMFNGTIKYVNCTFVGVEDQLAYGISAYLGGKALLYGGLAGQTFTNVWRTLYFSSTVKGAYYEVYNLDLTVNDSGGSPLQNAFVDVRCKLTDANGLPYEHGQFLTDVNGNIKDLHGDDPVFTRREILSRTPTYDEWSDGTGNKVHIITISHPDYAVDTREVTFDSDQTIVAQLTTNAPAATTIYGSTIYGSTIY